VKKSLNYGNKKSTEKFKNINLELRTLSTWHTNQQVDGGHYEAEAEAERIYRMFK